MAQRRLTRGRLGTRASIGLCATACLPDAIGESILVRYGGRRTSCRCACPPSPRWPQCPHSNSIATLASHIPPAPYEDLTPPQLPAFGEMLAPSRKAAQACLEKVDVLLISWRGSSRRSRRGHWPWGSNSALTRRRACGVIRERGNAPPTVVRRVRWPGPDSVHPAIPPRSEER